MLKLFLSFICFWINECEGGKWGKATSSFTSKGSAVVNYHLLAAVLTTDAFNLFSFFSKFSFIHTFHFIQKKKIVSFYLIQSLHILKNKNYINTTKN